MTATFLGMPAGVTPQFATNTEALKYNEGSFPANAKRELSNSTMRRNLHHVTHTIRDKRQHAVDEMADWQALRDAGEAIKNDTISRLPELLEQLEANVTAHGGHVHWARDADEANRIVGELVKAKGVDDVVKVKSMATQEISLNEYLETQGVTAHETDLAELIVQLGHDRPSHILVPAIHRNRSEIREIFLREMDDAPSDLDDEPRHLAEASRRHLRQKFLDAKVAISGANFAAADTGTLSVFESEGNGRMCLTLPETLITVMGIEKVIPHFSDLEVFTQLLPRSSTAERMNPYTTLWTGVTPGDGPQEFHLVLLDNGRTSVMADKLGRAALRCIRCSACLNICPVYEHTGGHAYGSVYPGPIGAILTPQLTGATDHNDPNYSLPYASSLCGACFEVCPVKIDIPTILVQLRGRMVDAGRKKVIPSGQDIAMKSMSFAMSSGKRFAAAEKAVPLGRVVAGKDHKISGGLPFPLTRWLTSRDIPAPPRQTFREWWKNEHEAPARPAAPKGEGK